MDKKFVIKVKPIKAHSTKGIQNRSKVEIPSKYGYKTYDLQRICVYSHTYDNEDKPFYIG